MRKLQAFPSNCICGIVSLAWLSLALQCCSKLKASLSAQTLPRLMVEAFHYQPHANVAENVVDDEMLLLHILKQVKN